MTFPGNPFQAIRSRQSAQGNPDKFKGLGDAINRRLLHAPTQVGRSRIKRLRGTRKPQYRLRIGDVRVFYDVREGEVEVLAIVEKSEASEWLKRIGEYDEESSAG